MKFIIVALVSLFSIAAFALPKASITGQDGQEIFDLLRKNNVQVTTKDAGGPCDEVSEVDFFGMVCQSAVCYSREVLGDAQITTCYFDKVRTQDDLYTIKAILKTAGLNPENALLN